MSAYIVTADIGLRVRSAPFIPTPSEPDNKIDLLPYGQEVTLLERVGKWFRVEYESYEKIKGGWVSSEYLESEAIFLAHSKPVFKIGVPNLWSGINTKIVRKAIGDEFGGGKHKWNLQCTEYVYYKLKESGVTVNWPVRSGRDGGKWGKIFKQAGLYTVSDQPTTGSAMCFTDGFRTVAAKQTGHVAFVDKVLPDGSVFISEVNIPNLGKYNERTISATLCRERYKAEFINFQ